MPLLAEGKEVAATLELRRLVGAGVEGGGRFVGEVGFAVDADDGGDDEVGVRGRFEVDADVSLGRVLIGADARETFDGEGFADEDGEEDGMIREGVVGGLDAVADAGVVELDRFRVVIVPVSVLPAVEVPLAS